MSDDRGEADTKHHGSRGIQPDAWLFHYDISNCAVIGNHKELASKHAMKGLYNGENIEGDNCAKFLRDECLFAAETIQETIEEKIEELEKRVEKAEEKSIEIELDVAINQLYRLKEMFSSE